MSNRHASLISSWHEASRSTYAVYTSPNMTAVTKACQPPRVAEWADAKKKQQTAACLAPRLTKLPWRENSSQVCTHTHTHTPTIATMTSTQGWCHSSPYILFNHDQQGPHFPGNLTPVCFTVQINSEKRADFLPAEQPQLSPEINELRYQRRHWSTLSNQQVKKRCNEPEIVEPSCH